MGSSPRALAASNPAPLAEQRKKLRLGELLVQQGLITPDQLRIALTEQKNQQAPLGRLLVRLGFVTEAVIRDIMARTIGQEAIDLSQVVVDADAVKLVPQDFARRNRVLPIAFDLNTQILTIAVTEVFNVVAIDQLRATIGQQVKVKTVLAGEPGSRVTLLYGNRSAASTMFKEELEDLKNRHLTRLALHPVFSREQVDSPLNSGRLDREKIERFAPIIGIETVDQAFVCGPHALNDEVEAALLAAGLAPERIHVERFGVPPSAADAALHAPREGDATTARITVVRDGLTREIGFQPGDESILAAASRAGMDVPFSCKSGVCATCRAKLLQGQVRMDRNFALEKADLEAGFILTCQAHPLTERVVVSFDHR